MSQHFFTSDDLPNVTTAHSWVDEDASWWLGVQSAGATMALAAALTLAASTAAIAAQVFSFHQDDPQLTAAYEDEQTTQVNPYATTYAVPDPWRWDEQTPKLTAGYEDEQTCQVNPYAAAYTQPDTWPFDEQVPTLTAGYLDEGLWVNPVQLISLWPPQVLGDDNEIFQTVVVTGIPDDNETWQNPVQLLALWLPQTVTDDQVIVPQPAPGISDDNEIWQPLVAALVAPTIPIPPWLSEQADIVPQPGPGPTVLGRSQHLLHMPILPLPLR